MSHYPWPGPSVGQGPGETAAIPGFPVEEAPPVPTSRPWGPQTPLSQQTPTHAGPPPAQHPWLPGNWTSDFGESVPPPLPPADHPSRNWAPPGHFPPPSGQPIAHAPSARKRAKVPLVLGAVTLVSVLALVAGAGVVRILLGSQADTRSTPTIGTTRVTPSPSGTRPSTVDGATPTTSPTPGFRGTGRSDNVLYNVAWERDSGRKYCPALGPMEPTTAAPQASLRETVDCLVTLHRQVLSPVGITIDSPEVEFFRGQVTTPCGVIEDSSLGSLCLRDKTLYFSLNAAESTTDGYADNPLGFFWIAAHEFGHYVQLQAGMLTAGTGDNLTSRRIELQANCMAGMFMGAVWSQVDGNAEKHLGMHDFFRRIYGDQAPGQGTHGTPDSTITWYDHGFTWQWASFQRCNTFTAKIPELR